MDRAENGSHFLDYTTQPAFCVRDGEIISVNSAGRQRTISEGLKTSEILVDPRAYDDFKDGILCLIVHINDMDYSASVTRTEQGDVFVLDTPYTNDALQAMALAAQQLRRHLASVMAAAQKAQAEENTDVIRGLFRMQRALCNMSDIPLVRSKAAPSKMLELGSTIYEIVEKASTLLASSGVTIQYTGTPEIIHTAADYALLERAIYNLISNAVKFSEEGCTIKVSLSKKETTAVLTIEDSGAGIPTHMYGSLFTRYQREVSVSNRQENIGLGLAMVQAVAANHDGTVLITQAPSGGTRVALSLPIRTPDETIIRSPILPLGDYAGDLDHGLLELSDVLSSDLYSL